MDKKLKFSKEDAVSLAKDFPMKWREKASRRIIY
jgi:hypothetical protein